MLKRRDDKSENAPVKCLIEEYKICDNCCQCFICDLDPNKICDNCASCLALPDYNGIIIDDIIIVDDKNNSKNNKKKTK